MNIHLLYSARDFDFQPEPPPWRRVRGVQPGPGFTPCEQALMNDLELGLLFDAMARGDDFLFQVARRVVLLGRNEGLETIVYRQGVLSDCLRNESVVRRLYHVTSEAIEGKKQGWLGVLSRYPSGVLSDAVNYLLLLTDLLRKLRTLADEHSDSFESQGFGRLFAMVREELTDDYLDRVRSDIEALKLRSGTKMSARLGSGNEGTDYILHRTPDRRSGWLRRIFGKRSAAHTFHLDPRDQAGARALSELRDRGIVRTAVVTARASEQVEKFLLSLRTELAFYLGCLNLHHELARRGVRLCVPVPAAQGSRKLSATGLRDACLALAMEEHVVDNDLHADDRNLIILTGANRGGKSSFLRGIGLAQLMMQCGMCVAAENFSAEVCQGLFSHYGREEDAEMKSGKLDEELDRMSGIVDGLQPFSMVLFNESFSSTNEREGSEVSRQVVGALLESQVKVLFVTHFHDFARDPWKGHEDRILFLLAERTADGRRTFKLRPGLPLETSFGFDLYRTVFSDAGVFPEPDPPGGVPEISGS